MYGLGVRLQLPDVQLFDALLYMGILTSPMAYPVAYYPNSHFKPGSGEILFRMANEASLGNQIAFFLQSTL